MDTASWIAILQQVIRLTESEWKKEQRQLHQRYVDVTSQAIAIHHSAVASWSNEAHTYVAGLDNQASTVELSFTSIPRRFGSRGHLLEELDVLTADQHMAVLGDPGAGKTTTLRRLAQHVTQEPEKAAGDDLRFVVLVVCRDEHFDQASLYDIVGSKVGISGSLADALDDPRTRLYQLLDAGALVIIDGLDEVPHQHRVDLERAITQFARHLRRGKIVVSCRSADYVQLEGFQIAEILPLTEDQIRNATSALLETDSVDAFYSALSHTNEATMELATRPLFLAQMIAIFNAQGTIPDRPINLIETLIRLVIQEWDEQRRVRRRSQYAQFSAPEKRRFLADLALELLRDGLLRFSENDLADAYRTLAERYELPKGQAKAVARELESHTGLVVQSGDQYEYAHLSLQEYLAADAMVRGGYPATENWWHYPAVAAVATALSSDPSSWFTDLADRLPTPPDRRAIRSFLYRIAQEGPRFTRSADLGHQVLSLVWRLRREEADLGALGAQLSTWKPLRDSVFDAISNFTSVKVDGGRVRMATYTDGSSEADSLISVSADFLSSLLGPERLRQALARPS